MSDTTWEIPATAKAEGITITLGGRSIELAQGEAKIKIMKEQLGELSDKLYFLELAFQADAETIVEALCTR